jgi:tetratricopeptide (TPR) repeat protein
VVVSSAGSVVYRGRIDDRLVAIGKERAAPTRKDLREVLEAVAAGKPPPQSRTEVIGCHLPDVGASHPLSEAVRAKLQNDFEAQVLELDSAIAKDASNVRLYSRRGDAHLFLGHFREAVADFEKMIALDPAHDAPHWRLGIAWFFSKEFKKSSRQFEKYHDYDGRDRENGIWKFLADAHDGGVASAREKMLVYTKFDREPFPSLYEMFSGRKSSDDVLAEVKAKGLETDAAVWFFVNYYAGLSDDLLGNRERARELVGRAVAAAWQRRSNDSAPSYMWQVARVHCDWLGGQHKPADDPPAPATKQ